MSSPDRKRAARARNIARHPAETRRVRAAIPAVASIALLGAGLVFLLVTQIGPIDGLWSGDQGVRLEQIQSLLLTHFRSAATLYPGESIDPAHQFTPLLGPYLFRDGRSFSMFSEAWAGLNALFFPLFSYWGLYVVPIGSTLLLLYAAYRITEPILATVPRLLLLACLAATTPLLFYSLVFWDHTLVAMLVLTAVWLVLPGQTTMRRIFFAGLLLGVAVWFRPEIVLFFPAIAGALLWSGEESVRKRLLALGAGGAAGLLPFFLFNQLVYGVFVGPHVAVAGHATYTTGFHLSPLWSWRLHLATMLLAPPWTKTLIVIALLFVLRLLDAIGGWISRVRVLAASSLLLIAAAVLVQRRLDDGLHTTLLATAPLCLLLLLPPPWTRRAPGAPRPQETARRREANESALASRTERFLATAALLYVALAFLAGIPDGGAQWGPRMILPAIPLLVISGVIRVAAWTRRSLPGYAGVSLLFAFAALCLVGAGAEARGVRFIRIGNESSTGLRDYIVASGQKVVVCSNEQVPSLLAPVFYRGLLVFRAESGERVRALAERLSARGFRTFLLFDRPEIGLEEKALASPALVVESAPQIVFYGFRATVLRIR